MAPRRIDPRELPPRHPLAVRLRAQPEAPGVTLEHDGVAVPAREGEPVALALAAAGRLTLSRSPKYHRPRGPMCMRGGCEGCLVRVDDTPGVMACQTPARPGMKITSQNAFPTAGFDVFRLTDWFFPKHLDHHHLMVQFGGALNRTMQSFARQMAGLGTLPDAPGAVVPHRDRDVDALVVGAGSSGTAAANALRAAGFSVLVVEEDDAHGGSRRDRVDDAGALHAPEAETLTRAAAVATYDDATLVLHDGALVRVRARARLFANGTHDLVGTFGRNDLPGIFTLRAFSRALARGVLLGERVLVVGEHPWAPSLVALLSALRVEVTHVADGEVLDADGVASVSGARVRSARGEQRHACDALVIAAPPAAAYELAGQAGASVAWEPARSCFAPQSDDDGATAAEGVFVCGTLRRDFDTPAAREADGARVAARMAKYLGGAR